MTTTLPLPSPRQLRHHAREFIGFLHFTTNTFTDKEWGFGDESPSIFNPTAFDADQIVDSARLAGMRSLILTCKHHDGFCLWPSAHTNHSVRNSPFRAGRGDVVREIEQACRRAKIEFGVYLSPWDRNHAAYSRPEYVDYYRAQLRELLTNYGEISEVWFDGANGGDGFYGGAIEKRHIDNRTYYGWPQTWQIVRELQPNAVMFSDVGPDVRWIGNEAGIAGDPCWYTLNLRDFCPGQADAQILNRGDVDGTTWLVPESDVSIRPGWFYHAHEDPLVRSPKNLVDLYFASVGRGSVFLLNLPPDRRGQIHENDRHSLQQFRAHLDRLFADDLAEGATISQSRDAAGILTLTIHLARPAIASVIDLREDITKGQRILKWELDVTDTSGTRRSIVSAEAVGHRRLIRFAPVEARDFHLRITETRGEPQLTAIRFHREPDQKDSPVSELATIIPSRITQISKHELVLDLAKPTLLRGIRYSPRVDHRADRYSVTLIPPNAAPGQKLEGEFGNIRFSAAPQIIPCDVTVQQLRFTATRFCMGDTLDPEDITLIPA